MNLKALLDVKCPHCEKSLNDKGLYYLCSDGKNCGYEISKREFDIKVQSLYKPHAPKFKVHDEQENMEFLSKMKIEDDDDDLEDEEEDDDGGEIYI